MSDKLKISISGVRGIIGEGLNGQMVLNLAAAFGQSLNGGPVIVGRDARPTGPQMRLAVLAGLAFSGNDAIDIGLAPTPTVGLMVNQLGAAGGIQISASHNPVQWNALKFFNREGFFLNQEDFERFMAFYEKGDFGNATWDRLGKVTERDDAIDIHIDRVLNFVDVEVCRSRKLKVVVDGCRSVGGLILPPLLAKLGCEVIRLDCEADGQFTRPLEPTPAHLGALCAKVKETGAEVGFAADPDADRLAMVSEKGEPLGEDFSLALAADYIAGKTGSDIVTNLSTTMALDDIARKHGVKLYRTKVGEAHVVEGILKHGVKIGGEGNGGVIVPEVHPGRDAATGVAVICELLATKGKGKTISEVASEIPLYHIVKDKVPAREHEEGPIAEALCEKFGEPVFDRTEGLKLIWPDAWVHLRPSNTEPIIRIIAEAKSPEKAKEICSFTRSQLE